MDALILHVITIQNATLFQLVECGDDLLKGAIDDCPCLVNIGFHLLQLVYRLFPSAVSYRQPRIPKDTGILKGWQTRIFAFASAENCGNSGTRRAGLRLTWPNIQASAERIFPIWKPERRSRIARSGNPGTQLWNVSAEGTEQNVKRYSSRSAVKIFKPPRVCRNYVGEEYQSRV